MIFASSTGRVKAQYPPSTNSHLPTLTSSPRNTQQTQNHQLDSGTLSSVVASTLLAEVPSMPAAVKSAAAGVGFFLLSVTTGVVRTALVGSRARAGGGTTGPDGRARHRIVLHATPDAEVERRVVLLVATGELDRSVRRSIATASDLDLGASKSSQYLIK